MSIHGVLGENTTYSKTYDPNILYPIARHIGRDEILKQTGFDFNGVDTKVNGIDIWQAFELSWLNHIGVPQVAMARLYIPAMSNYIVESKSLKLYFNSLNFTIFNDIDELKNTICQDISKCIGMAISVALYALDGDALTIARPVGICIDACLNQYGVPITPTDDIDDAFLKNPKKGELTQYKFYSHLLRSNCPVTNQPDWGTVQIEINTECQLDFERILQYILSFRQHNGFHEQCVERIFADFFVKFNPASLMVMANYTRRGGIDINPVRTFNADIPSVLRLSRQ